MLRRNYTSCWSPLGWPAESSGPRASQGPSRQAEAPRRQTDLVNLETAIPVRHGGKEHQVPSYACGPHCALATASSDSSRHAGAPAKMCASNAPHGNVEGRQVMTARACRRALYAPSAVARSQKRTGRRGTAKSGLHTGHVVEERASLRTCGITSQVTAAVRRHQATHLLRPFLWGV